MEKEALTLHKIKKDINRKLIAGLWEFFVVGFLFFTLLTIQIYGNSDADTLLEKIVMKILTAAFGALFIYEIVTTFKLIINVWNRKYKLVTEVLVAKEENTDYRYWLNAKRSSIWESKYRADCDNNYFTLIFNRSGTYKILFTKYYKWSAKYSMGPRELYITSEAGDTFTIVKFKNKIFMVYNNKYFEPTFNLH